MVDISVVLDRDRDASVRYAKRVVTHSLTVNAFADGRAVAVDFSIVGVRTGRTPFSVVLPERSYTLRFPDSITIEGVTYDYDTHTVT